MPTVINFRGYYIFFWANEGNEPVHIHVSKGRPTQNSPKIWVPEKGAPYFDSGSDLPGMTTKDIKHLLTWAQANKSLIYSKWNSFFNN